MLSEMGEDMANRHLAWIAVWAFIGVVVLGIGVALIGTAQQRDLGWVWWLVGACGAVLVFSIFAAVSPFLGTWPYRDGPTVTDAVGFRTPAPTVHVTGGAGIVLTPGDPNSKVKPLRQGPFRPGLQTGDLPVNMTTRGPIGTRESEGGFEEWIWTLEDVTLVNESSEYITAHAWLTVVEAGLSIDRQLERNPNTPLVLAPHETRQETLVFRVSMAAWTQEERLVPGRPTRLDLLGASSIGRSRTVFFFK